MPNCNMDTLTFKQGHRKGLVIKNQTRQTERKYFDFIVSGQSLGQLFGLPDFDLIGTFGWTENKEIDNKQIDEFLCLSTTELPTGRTMFYVCPECGDIGCGAITAKIEMTESKVIWKDFGYENDYLEQPDLTNYKEIRPLEFDKTQYRQVFEKLRTNIKENNWE